MRLPSGMGFLRDCMFFQKSRFQIWTNGIHYFSSYWIHSLIFAQGFLMPKTSRIQFFFYLLRVLHSPAKKYFLNVSNLYSISSIQLYFDQRLPAFRPFIFLRINKMYSSSECLFFCLFIISNNLFMGELAKTRKKKKFLRDMNIFIFFENSTNIMINNFKRDKKSYYWAWQKSYY